MCATWSLYDTNAACWKQAGMKDLLKEKKKGLLKEEKKVSLKEEKKVSLKEEKKEEPKVLMKARKKRKWLSPKTCLH